MNNNNFFFEYTDQWFVVNVALILIEITKKYIVCDNLSKKKVFEK